MTFPVKVFHDEGFVIILLHRLRPVGHGIYQTDTAFPYYYYYYHYHGSCNYHCRCYYYYCCCYRCATTRTTDRNRTGRALKHISLKTHIISAVVTKRANRSYTCSADVLFYRRGFTNSIATAAPEDYLPKSAHTRSLDQRRPENLYRNQ